MSIRSRLHLAAASLPLMLLVALSGCATPLEPIAVIHYRQLGACTHAQTGNGAITAPPSHAIVVFKVSHIDNTRTAKSWSFDSTALQVNPPSQMQQNLGGTGPVAIAAGQDVPVDAWVGILVETANADGSDAASSNDFLLYPLVPPAPGTLAAKDNSSQLTYPFAADCSGIAG